MDFIKFLLVKGADPNFKCKDGNTPMHIAFKAKNAARKMATGQYIAIWKSRQNEKNNLIHKKI